MLSAMQGGFWKGFLGFMAWAIALLAAILIFMGSVPPEAARENFEKWLEPINFQMPGLNMIPGLNSFQLLGFGLLALNVLGVSVGRRAPRGGRRFPPQDPRSVEMRRREGARTHNPDRNP